MSPPVALLPARLQEEWDLYHATWFSLMGVGGGVFLLARLLGPGSGLGALGGVPVADAVSFAAIAVGGLVLLRSLGRPLRVLRALARSRTSWISRGAIADAVFLAAGGLLALPGVAAGGAGRLLEALALVAAAVVIVYAGLVLADRTAIPYWRSWAIPAQLVCSSLATSAACLMGLEALAGAPVGAVEPGLLLGFSGLLLGTLAWHLGTRRATPGKAESLERLGTTFRRSFAVLVLGAGIALPIGCAAVGLAWAPARAAAGLVALAGTLAGGFWLRLLTLRVGYFAPVSAAFTFTTR